MYWIESNSRLLAVVVIMNMLVLEIVNASATPFGHDEPFGRQGQSEVNTDELDVMPSSALFWKDYVKPNRPVVFRGAAKQSRAYQYWTEDYLVKKFGDLAVRLEGRQEGNGHIPVGRFGLGLDTLSNFLSQYQTLNGYAITQLPEPMEDDVTIPSCLTCGTFKDRIQEIHMFLSARGGQTLLHRDPFSSIHCIFNGSKDWTLVHPRQLNQLYMSTSSLLEWGGFSDIDPNKIDLIAHPLVASLEISKVHMEKGDCIFMPGGYWHFVDVKGYMNSAVSIWFSRMQTYEDGPCVSEIAGSDPTAAQVPVIWRFSGHGNLTQGHLDLYVLKQVMLKSADGAGKIWLQTFVDTFMALSEEWLDNSAMAKDLEERKQKFVTYFNKNDPMYVTKDDLDRLTQCQFKELTEIIHPNDVSNTDKFEYSHLQAEDLRAILYSCYDAEHFSTFDSDCIRLGHIDHLGGTPEKADEIINSLGSFQDLELPQRIEMAISGYTNALYHDPETEQRMFKFLVEQKEVPWHDEL